MQEESNTSAPSVVTSAPGKTSTVDFLENMFLEMKTRLLSVEMLWTRVKQLEMKIDFIETTQQRLNGRLSNYARRQYGYSDQDREVTDDLNVGTDLTMAEEESKRQHLDRKLSYQQPQPQTTI